MIVWQRKSNLMRGFVVKGVMMRFVASVTNSVTIAVLGSNMFLEEYFFYIFFIIL